MSLPKEIALGVGRVSITSPLNLDEPVLHLRSMTKNDAYAVHMLIYIGSLTADEVGALEIDEEGPSLLDVLEYGRLGTQAARENFEQRVKFMEIVHRRANVIHANGKSKQSLVLTEEQQQKTWVYLIPNACTQQLFHPQWTGEHQELLQKTDGHTIISFSFEKLKES